MGRGKQVEINYNNRLLGEFETVFNGEMETNTNIMEYIPKNKYARNITLYLDA
jgi:hypothetical protein